VSWPERKCDSGTRPYEDKRRKRELRAGHLHAEDRDGPLVLHRDMLATHIARPRLTHRRPSRQDHRSPGSSPCVARIEVDETGR